MSFAEVDKLINQLVGICIEMEATVEKAGNHLADALDAAHEAELQAKIASIHAQAEAELQKSVKEYRDWEARFTRKAGLFDKGALN